MRNYVDDIRTKGFAIIPNVIDTETTSRLCKELKDISCKDVVRKHVQSPFGIRNLLNIAPFIRDIADRVYLRSGVESILGKHAKVVRGIFFDKTPEANWKVGWHQDLTISVRKRIDVPGFSSWSIKAGIPHVQPPISLMEKILTLRLYLDDSDESNGTLKVIPGSHKCGRMNAEEIRKWKEEVTAIACPIMRGGVMAMYPLLLHSSAASLKPLHRRVIHLEFSSSNLPAGLDWYGS